MDDLNSTEEIFNVADTNNDQQLTTEEAKVLPEVDTNKEFKLADKNKDKLISFNEYMTALPEENRNAINNAPNEKVKYNAFSKTLNDYYNDYVGSLDQADPDYDDKVALAKDNAVDQLKDSGYWGVNPDTGKDFIIDQDSDKKSISKDARVKSRINDVLNNNEIEHNIGEMAELLNDVIPSLPEYKETEKYENGKRVKEGWEAQKAAYDVLGDEAFDNVDYSGLGKVKDTGEIWQESVLKDVYERLSKWNFDELYELSQKAPNIRWKRLANAVARSEVSDKDDQRKRSKEWMQQWKDYVSKVDLAAEHLNKISNEHIDKEEVEQILYRDYVQEAKQDKKEDKKPIQITEKTDVRERIIEEASQHIIKHGRSLPKELKKSIQEIPAKFIPFKFDHDTKKEDGGIESKPIAFDNETLGIELGNAAEGNIPNGSVMQSGFGSSGSSGGSIGRSSGRNISSSRSSAGGMSLPDLPETKFNMGSIGFEGIGSFSKKKHPINIKMTNGSKTKKALEFPDLSPDVEQHNEMERIPKSAKNNRPIIKRGLYQDKDDKWDNDLYSNVISDIIDQYREWEKVGDEYVFNIPELNIKLFYDGFSQPKIRVIGLGNKQNISTLLRREGGREALENLYNYLEGGK